jgi:TonB family protein
MRLKFTLAFVFNLISATCVLSQEKEFFDKDDKKSTEDQAAYYRVATRNEEGKLSGLVKEYYLNNKIRKVTEYEEGNREGQEISYYPNGQQETEQRFEKGRQIGPSQSWYANGQLKETGTVEVRETQDTSPPSRMYVYRIEAYYDSTGRVLVDHGNGEYVSFHEAGGIFRKGNYTGGYQQGQWLEYYPDGKLSFSEKFDRGELIGGVSYDKDGSSQVYTVMEQMPEFKGGINALMNYLATQIKYPRKSQRQGIEGTVFVNFIVAKNGQIDEVAVVKGVGEECDAESMRVVRKMPPWKPGIQRGRAVPVRYTLPIRFRLH